MIETTSLVFVGVAALDTIALVGRLPQPDERITADAMTQAGGGPAATAAVTAARLGLRAAFVGAAGDDEDGDRILAGLSSEGVDVSGVIRVPGARSAASIGLVHRQRRGRALVTRVGPALHIARSGRAAELLAGADWVHADHAGWKAVLPWRARAHFRLSVDEGNPIPGLCPEGVDLYVPTLAVLRARYGDHPAPDLLGAALAEGARCVVATRGEQGCLGARPGETPVRVGALPVAAVSTLGAGDVFHGALLAATVRGMPFGERLSYAAAAAGLSCRALDGRGAIPSHAETLAAAAAAPATTRTDTTAPATGTDIPPT